jgi:hypothetical protein
MTNLLQRDTAQQSLLDGVEPDAWAHPSGGYISRKYKSTFATGLEKETFSIPLYSRETVEALLEANRKQVLLEAAEHCEKKADTHGWNYNLPSVGRELGADFRRILAEKGLK